MFDYLVLIVCIAYFIYLYKNQDKFLEDEYSKIKARKDRRVEKTMNDVMSDLDSVIDKPLFAPVTRPDENIVYKTYRIENLQDNSEYIQFLIDLSGYCEENSFRVSPDEYDLSEGDRLYKYEFSNRIPCLLEYENNELKIYGVVNSKIKHLIGVIPTSEDMKNKLRRITKYNIWIGGGPYKKVISGPYELDLRYDKLEKKDYTFWLRIYYEQDEKELENI